MRDEPRTSCSLDHEVKRDMRNRHRQVLLIPAALSVTACALYFPRTPILPETFEGPLSASADSLVASTQPSYCAPVRHLDFGTTPQGCVRGGDTRGWVNWTGAGHVVTLGREWIQPDGVTALRVGRSWKASSRADWDHPSSATTRISGRRGKSDGLQLNLPVFPPR